MSTNNPRTPIEGARAAEGEHEVIPPLQASREPLAEYHTAVNKLRDTLKQTREFIVEYGNRKVELETLKETRTKVLDHMFRHRGDGTRNGTGEKKLEDLEHKKILLEGKRDWLSTEIDSNISILQGQLQPLSIYLSTLHAALANHTFTLSEARIRILLHPSRRADLADSISLLANATVEMADVPNPPREWRGCNRERATRP